VAIFNHYTGGRIVWHLGVLVVKAKPRTANNESAKLSATTEINLRTIIPACLVIVAIIHLLPLSGVIGGERLSRLYGLAFHDPNLAILMRHRAVLFGMLGFFLLFAAFKPALQPLAFIAGFVSVISFLVIAWSVGDYNPQIKRVVIADIVALVCLAIAVLAYFFAPHKP